MITPIITPILSQSRSFSLEDTHTLVGMYIVCMILYVVILIYKVVKCYIQEQELYSMFDSEDLLLEAMSIIVITFHCIILLVVLGSYVGNLIFK